MTLFVGALAPAIWLQPGEEGMTKPAVFRPARELYPNGELRLGKPGERCHAEAACREGGLSVKFS